MVMEVSDTVETTATVSTIAAADISEDLPNNDEPSFSVSEPQTVSVSVSDIPNVLVATSQELLTAEQLQETRIKTTHIVIHDQTKDSRQCLVSLDQTAIDVLKTARTSLDGNGQQQQGGTGVKEPKSPVTPSIEANSHKYNWDSSVHDPVLPVRCRNVCGYLHKNKFGSGGRGRCIKSGNNWYTPSEFEALCGRASSKDWKRSIRYAGRTLLCLIEEGLLLPHATSCTCAACCDDMVVSGPVRLYTPYKRRKKDESGQQDGSGTEEKDAAVLSDAPLTKDLVVTLSRSSTDTVVEQPKVVSGNLIDSPSATETIIDSPVSTPQTPRSAPTALDFSEQRQWWQLEEMVKNLVKQVQELQKQVDIVKAQSAAARDAAVQQLKIQMESEKKEALNNAWVEAQMNLNRALLEARAEKDIAVQQALQQVRAEMQTKNSGKKDSVKLCANCNRKAFSECTGCHNVSYCSAFCQRKDWNRHQTECGETTTTVEEEEPPDSKRKSS